MWNSLNGRSAWRKKMARPRRKFCCVSAESLAAGVRLGEVEKLKSSRERRLGLRVFVGQSSANASTAEIERDGLAISSRSTVGLAR